MLSFSRKLLPLAGTASLMGILTAGAAANGLFPPPGPPQPTMKRLDQVSSSRCISSLPFVIDEPGRYEVCGNLDASSDGHGITISASNVTLDLGGYTLHGGEGSGNGIHVSSGSDNVTIRNGNLVGWGGDGINARATDGDLYCWGVRASFNQGDGISLKSGEIHDSVCHDNMGDGINGRSDDGGTLWCWGSNANRNAGNGISITSGGIENTVCRDNIGHGVHVDGPAEGFLDESISLAKVSCTGNGSSGITITNTPPVAIDSCITSGNTGHGLHIVARSGRTGRNPQTGKEIKIAASSNTGSGVVVEVMDEMETSFDFSSSSFSNNGERGFSAVCPEGSNVSISLDRCETNGNAQQGIHTMNASLSSDRCVIEGNTGHGLHQVFQDSSKSPANYNNSRSNRSTIIGNGGGGVVVEAEDGTELSVSMEDSTMTGNTGAGFSSVCGESSLVSVSLARCETKENGQQGVHVVNANLALERCISSFNTGHGYHVVYNDASKAQNHNSSRSNRTEGISNGGSGFELEIETANKVAASFSDGDFSENGTVGINIQNDPPVANSVSISVDRCVLNNNATHGKRVQSTGSGNEITCKASHLSVGGNGSGGIDIDCNDGNGGVHPSSYTLASSDVSGNGGNGFSAVCSTLRVTGSSLDRNVGGGLVCGTTDHFLVETTTSSSNGGNGITADCPIIEMRDVTAVSNGADGAVCDADSFKVSACLFSSNEGRGLHCPRGGGMVVRCVISSNDGGGIRIDGSGTEISDNVVSGHVNTDSDAAGISIHGTGNRVRGNMTSGNNHGVALFANGNPVYQGSSSGGENPLFEDAGVSNNSAGAREIGAADSPFQNILH